MGRSVLRALVLLAFAASPVSAAKGPKTAAVFKTAPDFASHEVKSIAVLPVATFDRNTKAAGMIAAYWGPDLRSTGYRWISTQTTRDMIASAFGDSMLEAIRVGLLKDIRLDSLLAPALCAKLRVNALLCARLDQWEQRELLWSQSGRPSTSVQFKAALVDSAGALLWSGADAETAEGLYHDPGTNPLGVSSSGLDQQPIKGEGGPPSFEDVLHRIFQRWVGQFPRPVTVAVPATPAAPSP
jgi:hypothetical protein